MTLDHTKARGADPYPAFLHEHIETMPREDIERHQEAQLSAMLEHACKHSALTAQVWKDAGVTPSDIKSLAGFSEKAPFLNKDSLRHYRDTQNDPYGGVRAGNAGQVKGVGTTSGTTGDPTAVPGGPRQLVEHSYAREMWHVGMRPGDYVCNFAHALRSGYRNRVQQEIGVTPIAFSMLGRSLPAFCEASRRFRPTSVKILTNPLLIGLEQYFEQSGVDPEDVFSSYTGAIFAGEPLGDRMRKVTAGWGLELFEGSALGDICSMGECKAHAGMHAWEDMALVECVDPVTNEPVPDGKQGEMIVTSLADRIMPLIRYRTDDIVTIDRSPCACGRTHLRLTLFGRKGDQCVVDGVSVMPKDLIAVVEAHDETRAGLFQIVRAQREMDVLRVRIGYDPARLSGPAAQLAGRLADHISERLGVRAAVELELNDELLKLGPPNKIPRVTKQ